MFDFHLHSTVSYDGQSTGEEMVRAAAAAGLKEICFTDHLDYDPLAVEQTLNFDTAVYNAAYDHLQMPGLKIRRGMEFGMLPDNRQTLQQDLQRRHFDFVIGSVHFVDGLDIYLEPFWAGKTMEQAERRFLEETLACVQVHDDYDVLGHLTYISKTRANPTHRPIPLNNYREITDEILKILVRKGKGLEINTSGMVRCEEYLPSAEYLRRFKELGGEIVTVGSDAHSADRVGEHCADACQILKDIFGYVCTFEDRKPIFHKL